MLPPETARLSVLSVCPRVGPLVVEECLQGRVREARNERPSATSGTGHRTQAPPWSARKNSSRRVAFPSPSMSSPQPGSEASFSALSLNRSAFSPTPFLASSICFSLFLVLLILSALGRWLFLPPFSSHFVYHSSNFFNPFILMREFCQHSPFSLLSVLFLGEWVPLCFCLRTPSLRPSLLAVREASAALGECEGHPEGQRAGWEAFPTPCEVQP